MMQLAQVLSEQYESVWEKLNDNPSKVYFPNFGSGDNALKSGIDIDRVAFKIPGTNFEIYWYGLTIAVGIILAMIYGFKKMKKAGIDPDRATDAVIGGFFGAIIGARLYYILFSDSTPFSKFFDFREGGLAIYGGIIGAILVGGVIVKLKKLRLTTMLDVVAPCFLIGQCLGRWGNFFNQEAFGTNTTLPWGMLSKTTATYIQKHVTDGSVIPTEPIHPCFLYESLWCLIGFIILHLYFKHRKFDGEVFLCYTAWYGLGRFFIEGLRTDSLYIGNIRVSQLLAAACVVISVIAIIVVRVRISKYKDYVFFKDTELSKAQIAQYDQIKKLEKEKKALRKKISEAENKGDNSEDLKKEYKEKFGPEARKKINQAIDDAEKADKEAEKQRKLAREAARQEKQEAEKDEEKAETVSDKADEIEEKADEVKEEISEKNEEVKTETVQAAAAAHTADAATETVEQVKEEVSEKAQEVKPQPKKNRKKSKKPQTQKAEAKKEEVEKKAEELKEEVSGKAEEIKEEVAEKAEEVKTEVTEEPAQTAEALKEEAVEAVQKVVEEAAVKTEEVKEELSEKSEETKTAPAQKPKPQDGAQRQRSNNGSRTKNSGQRNQGSKKKKGSGSRNKNSGGAGKQSGNK